MLTNFWTDTIYNKHSKFIDWKRLALERYLGLWVLFILTRRWIRSSDATAFIFFTYRYAFLLTLTATGHSHVEIKAYTCSITTNCPIPCVDQSRFATTGFKKLLEDFFQNISRMRNKSRLIDLKSSVCNFSVVVFVKKWLNNKFNSTEFFFFFAALCY